MSVRLHLQFSWRLSNYRRDYSIQCRVPVTGDSYWSMVKREQIRCGRRFANPPAKRKQAQVISLNLELFPSEKNLNCSQLISRPRYSCHIIYWFNTLSKDLTLKRKNRKPKGIQFHFSFKEIVTVINQCETSHKNGG